MINLIRKNQQFLMILITLLVIISFVWFYNGSRTNTPVVGTKYVARIYDRPISQTEADSGARRLAVANVLQLTDLENSLVGRPASLQEAQSNFILNSLVVAHEAQRLQIVPTDEEVKTAIMAIPRFQTNGAFDSGKYTNFVEDVMASYGFTSVQLEDLMRDDLRVKKIKELLNTTVVISPAAFRTLYEHDRQKMDVSVIRFNLADFASGVQVSPEDVNKVFAQHFDSYKSEEKRKIKFVTFSLSDADKALSGKDRMDALKKLSEKAEDFTQAMLDKSVKFDDAAAKAGVPVVETGLFTQASPDPKIEKMPGVTDAAFRATKDQPDSDAIQGEDGNSYYVLHLEEIEPSRALTFEEASPQIAEALKNSRAHELLSLKGAEVRNQIASKIQDGKSFADAVKDLGLKAETFPPFSLAEPNVEAQDSREIMYAASGLKDGQVGEFMPTPDGGLLVHMDKREPIDEKTFEKDKALLEPSFVQQNLTLVFADWLRKQTEDAKIQFLGGTPAASPGTRPKS